MMRWSLRKRVWISHGLVRYFTWAVQSVRGRLHQDYSVSNSMKQENPMRSDLKIRADCDQMKRGWG
jgi:hypothetical protein